MQRGDSGISSMMRIRREDVLVAGGTYSMLEDFSALPTQRNCTAHYRVRVFVAATWSECVDSAATVVLCTSRVS